MALINVEHVSKSYNGQVGADVPVLFDISVEIGEGEFVALMGPSGSGKSTLLTIVGGMSHPSSGKLRIDGIDVYSLSDERLSARGAAGRVKVCASS